MRQKVVYTVLYGDKRGGFAGSHYDHIHDVFVEVQEALQGNRPFEVREERVLLTWKPPASPQSDEGLPY